MPEKQLAPPAPAPEEAETAHLEAVVGTPEEAPPFLGTWRNVYLFVAVELAVTILALWIFREWAS